MSKKEEATGFKAPELEEDDIEMVQQPIVPVEKEYNDNPYIVSGNQDNCINCLRNEKVIVRHIPKQTGMITDPNHVLYGGMSETSKKTFAVPYLKSGIMADVLTKDEKKYLEQVLGLEPNAMSIYNRVNNFWKTDNAEGINTVTLYKQDNIFDLSIPTDYIKVKILLAYKDKIAPSMEAWQDQPKPTYEFVIVSEKDKYKAASTRREYKKLCYKELGKIEDDKDILTFIIETIDGRPISSTSTIEMLQTKADDLITANASLFYKIATDELLPTKVMLKKALRKGVVITRNGLYYMKKDNLPLCSANQESTLNIAASFLNKPENQELKFSIEAHIK